MTKRERVERAYALEPADRVPFVPAVYEHKARLVSRTPSDVARSADLLTEALERELAVYDPDVLTVGLDVYNVEAEALGARVRWFDGSADVPAIEAPVINSPGDLKKLGLPDPSEDGRMPLFVEVARRLHRARGSEMIIRGAVTGPFSLACALTGTETLLVATIEEPAFVRRLLDFAGLVSVLYGRAFVTAGAEVVLFDSKATPAAASPRVFRDFILPVYRESVIPALREAGAAHLPLIIGGDTTSILDDLIQTGATQLLADAGCDLSVFLKRCAVERRPLRINVDPRLVHRGRPEEVREEAIRLLHQAEGQPGLLFGCGVVAWDTDPDNVLALRRARDEFCGV